MRVGDRLKRMEDQQEVLVTTLQNLANQMATAQQAPLVIPPVLQPQEATLAAVIAAAQNVADSSSSEKLAKKRRIALLTIDERALKRDFDAQKAEFEVSLELVWFKNLDTSWVKFPDYVYLYGLKTWIQVGLKSLIMCICMV